MATEIPMTEARARLADLANRAVYGGEHLVLTRHGKPFAALISAQDLARLEAPGPTGEESPSSSVANVGSSPQAYPMPIAATYSPSSEPSGQVLPGD